MVTTRVATLAQQQMITSSALRTQRNVNDLQVQIASGKKTQAFSGIADDASRLVNLKSELAQAEQFLQNITITEKRLDLMALCSGSNRRHRAKSPHRYCNLFQRKSG